MNMKTSVRYLIASGFTGFCLFPFYIIVTTSLKVEVDIFAWPPRWAFEPTLGNYYDALFVFGGRGIIKYLLNSLIVTGISTFLAVFVGSMVAYGLTRFRILGGKHLFFFILSTRFAPPVAFVVPLYLMVQRTGLLDTHLALILIYTSMNMSLVVWIMRGFFAEIPIEIEEAARVDGYTRLQIFRFVVMSGGRLLQVGTIRELLDRPATRFVAEFVGEPPINIFEDIEHEAGMLHVAGTRLPLSDKQVALLATANFQAPLSLGIRPDDLSLAIGCNKAKGLDAEVVSVQPMGDWAAVICRCRGSIVTIVVPEAEMPRVGAPSTLSVQMDNIHVFDASGTNVFLKGEH